MNKQLGTKGLLIIAWWTFMDFPRISASVLGDF
jgi:hypothetical protein